jgi:hypothetical protein
LLAKGRTKNYFVIYIPIFVGSLDEPKKNPSYSCFIVMSFFAFFDGLNHGDEVFAFIISIRT